MKESSKRLKTAWNWRTGIAFALISVVLSYCVAGSTGLIGMSLGLIASVTSVYGLWQAVSLTGRSANQGARPPLGAVFSILMFLIKLPVFVLCAMLSHTTGGHADNAFLAGLGLVYFGLVGWSLAHR